MRAIILGTCLVGVGALVVASLVPGGMRVQSGFPGELEHFVAYFGVAMCLCLANRSWVARTAAVAALIVAAAGLEWVQQFVPGRTEGLADFLASSGGAIMGMAIAASIWAPAPPSRGRRRNRRARGGRGS